jgi:hypothetical protein
MAPVGVQDSIDPYRRLLVFLAYKSIELLKVKRVYPKTEKPHPKARGR